MFFVEWLESINRWTCWSWISSRGSGSVAFGRIFNTLPIWKGNTLWELEMVDVIEECIELAALYS
jgi:hypothetical protein